MPKREYSDIVPNVSKIFSRLSGIPVRGMSMYRFTINIESEHHGVKISRISGTMRP